MVYTAATKEEYYTRYANHDTVHVGYTEGSTHYSNSIVCIVQYYIMLDVYSRV